MTFCYTTTEKLYSLRVYPEPSDAYEKDGKYIGLPDTHTLEECEEIIDNEKDLPTGEIVAVAADGVRYFAPRDGFGWMDVTKTEEI
ncbi:MAG TPA: hypothetical protein DCS66_24365 [Flavobacteriaceae bacterium]|nr:hypothetical protein [Flavobacteriaceae bacterium]|tara:strand:+ start:220 stop:477 length:258 start_codon:yes stop_codon:yes gene_type:complete